MDRARRRSQLSRKQTVNVTGNIAPHAPNVSDIASHPYCSARPRPSMPYIDIQGVFTHLLRLAIARVKRLNLWV